MTQLDAVVARSTTRRVYAAAIVRRRSRLIYREKTFPLAARRWRKLAPALSEKPCEPSVSGSGQNPLVFDPF